MRIDPIGNYNPFTMRGVQSSATVNRSKATEKTLPGAQTNNVQQLSISKEEKDFFVKLYPENSKEISNYHFYQRNGAMSGVAVGQMFDQRG